VKLATSESPVGSLAAWGRRRWIAAAGAATVTALVIGLPTDVIPNPIFGRPVAVTWWSIPILIVTSVLAGLLFATYVKDEQTTDQVDRPARVGGAAGLLSFFAIGCPVCNKLVVVALGTTGAMKWFEPIQPLLAVVSVGLLAVALQRRMAGERACPVPSDLG